MSSIGVVHASLAGCHGHGHCPMSPRTEFSRRGARSRCTACIQLGRPHKSMASLSSSIGSTKSSPSSSLYVDAIESFPEPLATPRHRQGGVQRTIRTHVGSQSSSGYTTTHRKSPYPAPDPGLQNTVRLL